MSAIPPNDEEITKRMRVAIMGLAVACPYDQGSPEDCQLCQVRNMQMKARLEWVDSLTLDEMLDIWDRHKLCLSAKLERQ